MASLLAGVGQLSQLAKLYCDLRKLRFIKCAIGGAIVYDVGIVNMASALCDPVVHEVLGAELPARSIVRGQGLCP